MRMMGISTTVMFVPMMEEFVGAAREGRAPSVTATDGRQVLEVLDVVVESGLSGHAVRLR